MTRKELVDSLVGLTDDDWQCVLRLAPAELFQNERRRRNKVAAAKSQLDAAKDALDEATQRYNECFATLQDDEAGRP